MAHEIETKVLDIDAKEILRKLRALGAKKVSGTRLKVSWYRLKGVKEGEDEWFLRIRTNSKGESEVTWKAIVGVLGVSRKCKEIHFKTDEPKKMAELFLEIGLEKYAYQEKDRTSFVLKNWRFDLDQYPKMPAFLEIEGTGEKSVRAAMALLGLSKNRTWAKGERILIQEVYHLDWYDMKF